MSLAGFIAFVAINCACVFGSNGRRPNYLIFMVDDLGTSDLGCFGNDSLKTPNVDRMASEGVRLSHHLAPESICTPSRAAFLTGRYAVRSGFGASEAATARVLIHGACSGGMPENETTFAKLLNTAGYSTGLIGKWHLGINCHSTKDFCHHPNNHGFDYFYGLPLTNLRDCGVEQDQLSIAHIIPHLRRILSICKQVCLALVVAILLSGNLHRLRTWLIGALTALVVAGFVFYSYVFITRRSGCILMRQNEVVEQPLQLTDLTQRLTSEAVWFLDEASQSQEQKPFLLFMSYAKVHTALFTTDAYKNHSGHSNYGDNVEEMDWSVGVIMQKLHDLGLDDETFVYFTSDHGPHLEEVAEGDYQGGWKGNLRGGKGQSWEGGVRVPGIARWPGVIPAGEQLRTPSTSLDVFATVLTAAGVPVPDDRVIDSNDMMPFLKGSGNSRHDILPHYCGTSLHAVTYKSPDDGAVYKAHYYTPKWTEGTQGCFGHAVCGCHGDDVEKHEPALLFSLLEDPSEEYPLDKLSQNYNQVMTEINLKLDQFVATVESVPNQVDSQWFLPWLQPYCNFPFYTCRETYPHQLVPIS